jgi:hypothetical protein
MGSSSELAIKTGVDGVAIKTNLDKIQAKPVGLRDETRQPIITALGFVSQPNRSERGRLQ